MVVVRSGDARKEELTDMVDGAALRDAMDAVEDHWLIGRLR